MPKYKYSEIFGKTIQGEGEYCGVPTVWLRFWGCNFECNGFGQADPANPSTYDLSYQSVDISLIKKMEDLPVFKTGCDSSYSWAKKFAHLAHSGTPEEICIRLEEYLKSESNPGGKFLHPASEQWTHMAFTGGEPMMNQRGIVDTMAEFTKRGNAPKFVTVETNGTQEIRKLMIDSVDNSINWFWSVSPKLYLSGEKWEDAIKPDILAEYYKYSKHGQLKYVSDGSARAWDEVEKATKLYRSIGIDWPVWIMPVGADIEGQNRVAAMVTEGAVERGYNVAARVHTYIFHNAIGK